jgi:hypothetical protein
LCARPDGQPEDRLVGAFDLRRGHRREHEQPGSEAADDAATALLAGVLTRRGVREHRAESIQFRRKTHLTQ